MNVYDVALDFVLLDAFSDLEHPPSTVLAVLQNKWITDGMKKSVGGNPVLSVHVLLSPIARPCLLLCGHY